MTFRVMNSFCLPALRTTGRAVLVALMITAAAPGLAARPSPKPLDETGFFGGIAEARVLHDRGVAGDRQAVLAAIHELEGILEDSPRNQLARVYLGSALTLRSRDLPPGPDKLAKLVEGGKLMDEAVRAAPNDIRVRFVRAVNYYNLPTIFGKRKLARSELLAIRDQLSEWADDLSAIEEQAMRYFAGRALADTGQKQAATEELRTALSLAGGSELAPQIEDIIKRLTP